LAQPEPGAAPAFGPAATLHKESCAKGQFVVGLVGRDGLYIDALGIICRERELISPFKTTPGVDTAIRPRNK
jgi:hypothetical protein